LETIQYAILIASAFKLLLQNIDNNNTDNNAHSSLEYLKQVEDTVLWSLIQCSVTTIDGLSVATIALGQSLFLRWKCQFISKQKEEEEEETEELYIAAQAYSFLHTHILSPKTKLPLWNKCAILKGILSTLPDTILLQSPSSSSKSLLYNPLSTFILSQSSTSNDSSVRLMTFKSLETILNRYHTILSSSPPSNQKKEEANEVITQSLQIIFSSWESPPNRQVSSYIPKVFDSLVKLKSVFGKNNGDDGEDGMDDLVERILAQPLHRRGRYIAMESLLPIVGPRKILSLGSSSSHNKDMAFITSLITRIGEDNSNAGVISSLWSKLLCRLREEVMMDLVVVGGAETKADLKTAPSSPKQQQSLLSSLPPEKWMNLWSKPLSTLLLTSSSFSKRNRISSFCLPLLEYIVGNAVGTNTAKTTATTSTTAKRKEDLSYVFAMLMKEVQISFDELMKSGGGAGAVGSTSGGDGESMGDRLLWAKLEIARHASLLKLTKSSSITLSSISTETETYPILRESLTQNLSPSILVSALKHEKSSIRVVAFQAIDAIIPNYYYYYSNDDDGENSNNTMTITGNKFQCIIQEMKLWKESLPYAMKSSEKEYISTTMQCLMNLLTRASSIAAHCEEEEEEEKIQHQQHSGRQKQDTVVSFVCDFLIQNIIIQQAAYPGTVADKECFVLSLLQQILAFASDDNNDKTDDENKSMAKKKSSKKKGASSSSSSSNKKKKTGTKMITKRKLTSSEIYCKQQILSMLISSNVFGMLFSMLHSMWDRTRSSTYDFMCDLIHAFKSYDSRDDSSIALPLCIASVKSRESFLARGIHLASSPRQREADTGARILAFLCIALPSQQEKIEYIEFLLDLLQDRVKMMESCLGTVTKEKNSAIVENTESNSSIDDNQCNSDDNIQKDNEKKQLSLAGGRSLPLAHGLIQGLRLSINELSSNSNNDAKHNNRGGEKILHLYDQIARVCCQSIQVSLAVVADIKDNNDGDDTVCGDETVGGSKFLSNATLDSSPESSDGNTLGIKAEENVVSVAAAPLNVNTGAIGANAVFASIKATSEEEEANRFATQRVVVGSWLLTKEACAALSSVITSYPSSSLPAQLVTTAGSLLISTLTSLKHQGAAFAAHRALQELSEACHAYSSNAASNSLGNDSIVNLPLSWARRLLHEISSTEIVRDSTLRRSTGYALGFLSVMRSEPPPNIAPRSICPFVLANIIRLSLPCATVMTQRLEHMTTSNSSYDFMVFIQHLSLSSQMNSYFVEDANYQWRSRVHALNVLRLAILDAPLASDMRKFVGDAIISAMIGYDDESWAVRNSATMVFAAAMLRVIDADKNASFSSSSSSRSQPNVKARGGNAITARELFRSYPSLPPFLLSLVEDNQTATTAAKVLHPPLFPFLLLLARLQPASMSTADDAVTETTCLFIKPVLQCLSHRHNKVRNMAARALAVLCSGDSVNEKDSSSRYYLLSCCTDLLESRDCPKVDWNKKHGALLGIRSLLLSSPNSRQLFDDQKLYSAVALYASWGSGAFDYPPSCVAVALDILEFAVCNAFNDAEIMLKSMGGKESSFLEVALFDAVHRIEALSHERSPTVMIGLSTLSPVVGKIAGALCSSAIFGSDKLNGDECNKFLIKIETIFCSNSFDVRLAAVKAFKKSIYGAVDSILDATNINAENRSRLMLKVGNMLLRVIDAELQRKDKIKALEPFFDGKEYQLGPHLPTLRRLSRCAIECFSACRSLPCSSNLQIGSSHSGRSKWDIFVQLELLGGGILEKVEEDNQDSAGNSVSGNSIELMALFLRAEMDSIKTKADAETLINHVKVFVSAVVGLADPLVPWSVRHSAAVAAGFCGMLVCDARTCLKECEQREIASKLQSQQLDLCMVVLKLVQDNDEDVRSAAIKALSSFLLSGFHYDTQNFQAIASVGNFEVSTVPLDALERLYDSVRNKHEKIKLIQRLLKMLVDHSQSMEEDLKLTTEEYKFSENIPSLRSILNLATTRKIFEEEDPNPFEESLVIAQLAVSMLVSSGQKLEDCGLCQDYMCTILSRCKHFIGLFKKRLTNSDDGLLLTDLAHDITWCNQVFSSMHGVILGSIGTIYLGGNDEQNVVKGAKSLMLLFSACSKNVDSMLTVHPCIFKALEVLSNAKQGCHKTYTDLLTCCFLLPGVHSNKNVGSVL